MDVMHSLSKFELCGREKRGPDQGNKRIRE
jgi:hypothetical protein